MFKPILVQPTLSGEVNSTADTATIVTLMGQHKGGLIGDSALWGHLVALSIFKNLNVIPRWV